MLQIPDFKTPAICWNDCQVGIHSGSNCIFWYPISKGHLAKTMLYLEKEETAHLCRVITITEIIWLSTWHLLGSQKLAGNIVIANRAALIYPYYLTVFMIRMGHCWLLCHCITLVISLFSLTKLDQWGPGSSTSVFVYYSQLCSLATDHLCLTLWNSIRRTQIFYWFHLVIEKPSDLTQLLSLIVPQLTHM